ncbi:hypothetical protein ABZ791_01050 [Streptomyces huasconensis]|uniref:Uncharacterized protein n=1 Tax=Streptomyces huasconensis TaxID=1854574 RepID=A0ABV3LVA6_9ACTN
MTRARRIPPRESRGSSTRRWTRPVAAVLAHRSEMERGAVPALIAALAPEKRARLLSTECVASVTGEQTELTA